MDRQNLTVLTGAFVTRVVFDGKRAVAIGIPPRRPGSSDWRPQRDRAFARTINTPKVLMQSGIGDERELSRAGIHVVQHLPASARISRTTSRPVRLGI